MQADAWESKRYCHGSSVAMVDVLVEGMAGEMVEFTMVDAIVDTMVDCNG